MRDQRQDGLWHKSARSGVQSNCVEARFDGVTVWVRNSNDVSQDRPMIGLAAERWLALLERVRRGDLGLDRLATPVRVASEVLVSFDGHRVVVRGDDGQPGVAYRPAEWRAFLEGVRHDGEFTLAWLGEPVTP